MEEGKMSNISMVESQLPPGFRFHPTDEELVCDYLTKKVTKSAIQHNSGSPPLIIEVDLNKCEPWDIPGIALIGAETACVGGKEWYFYSQLDRKYATGSRTNRATASGYWKATGKDRPVHRKGTMVGMRKTLVFYQGRAPKGRKTDWVMHEYRYEEPLAQIPRNKEDWVLCRVFYKSKEVAAAKPSMGICYDRRHTASSSLPPLMDSSEYITFDQTHNDNNNLFHHSHEQVPCFSILYQNQFTNEDMMTTFGQVPLTNTTTSSTSFDHKFSGGGDKEVINAYLTQLAKMESRRSPSLGEISTTSESYLSELGISDLWNHY